MAAVVLLEDADSPSEEETEQPMMRTRYIECIDRNNVTGTISVTNFVLLTVKP